MAEPTSAMSFEDMLVAIAEQLDIADWDSSDGSIVVPVSDKYNFELCRDIANRAIRMFIADAPPKGWRWTRRMQNVSLVATYTGTASGGSSTTLVDDSIEDDYDDDYFNGYTLYIEAGTGAGESATVTDFTGSSGTFTFSALSGGSTPDSTSEYSIARSTNAIDGDGSRYMLSEDFGGSIDGKITYAKDSSHSAIIDWVDEAEIRDARAVAVNSGYPTRAAIRPYSPTSSTITTNRRWEIIFDPRPSSADTVKFPYTMHFNKLRMRGGTATGAGTTTIVDSSRHEPDDYFNGWVVKVVHGTGKYSYATVTDYTGSSGTFTVADWLDEDGGAGGTDPATGSRYIVEPASNIHPAGFMFDEAIMAACLARAQMETEDSGDSWIQYYHNVALPEAHRIDTRSAPRRLGPMTNGPRRYVERTWEDVTTEHDL